MKELQESLRELQHTQMLQREQLVIGSLPPELRKDAPAPSLHKGIEQIEYPHDYATEVHLNSWAPGVVFFRYPVGVHCVETSLQATATTLAHPLGPAAYDPKGNIVGITHESAETIRAMLRKSI